MSRWKDGASALASLMVLILIIAVCSAIFSRITDSEEVPPETYTVASEPALSEAEPVEDSSSFRITFLNVGQGDATLVECDGRAMLVDGGECGSVREDIFCVEGEKHPALRLCGSYTSGC